MMSLAPAVQQSAKPNCRGPKRTDFSLGQCKHCPKYILKKLCRALFTNCFNYLRIPQTITTCNRNQSPLHSSLTVGSHGDEGGGGEEQDEDHVTAEEKPAQRGQVVEPGGRVSVERLVEERLEVGLPAERPNRPQTLQ